MSVLKVKFTSFYTVGPNIYCNAMYLFGFDFNFRQYSKNQFNGVCNWHRQTTNQHKLRTFWYGCVHLRVWMFLWVKFFSFIFEEWKENVTMYKLEKVTDPPCNWADGGFAGTKLHFRKKSYQFWYTKLRHVQPCQYNCIPCAAGIASQSRHIFGDISAILSYFSR